MPRPILTVVLSLLLPAIFQSLAAATVVDLTWTGTTYDNGDDGMGLFGPAGPMPNGVPYKARFRLDLSVGIIVWGEASDTFRAQQVRGGTGFGKPNPFVSADITINGSTIAILGEYQAEYYRQHWDGASYISIAVQSDPRAYEYNTIFHTSARGEDLYPLALDQPGDLEFGVSEGPTGIFLKENRNIFGDPVGPTTRIRLRPSHLSVTVVPELESMMYAMCGAAGAFELLRRRRVGSPYSL